MARELQLKKDEKVLANGQAMRLLGLLGARGELLLTNERICFSPKSRLDRLVGVSDVELPIGQIQKVTVQGLEKTIWVHHENGALRFSGRGAHRVRDRLMSVLGGQQGGNTNFEEGERVLVQGDAQVYMRAMVSSKGEIMLTDRRIKVESRGFLENLFFRKRSLDVLLDEVDEVDMEGISRILRLRSGEKEIRFGGQNAVQVFALLQGIASDMDDDSDEGVTPSPKEVSLPQIHSRLIAHWECSVFHGPLSVQGMLVLNTSGLHFTPTGALDAMVGAKEFSISLRCVRGLEVKGWPERRLIISEGELVHTLGMDAAIECFNELFELVVGLRMDRPKRRRLKQTDAALFLEQWKIKLDKSVDEQVELIEWGLFHESELKVRTGWVGLTNARIFFLPLRVDSLGDVALVKGVGDVGRISGQGRAQEELSLAVDHQKYRFTPRTGTRFVARFWSKCRLPDKIVDQREKRGGQSVSRVVGDLRFLKVYVKEEEAIYLKPAYLSRREKRLELEMNRFPDDLFEKGDAVVIEVGKAEGLYRFETEVLELDKGEKTHFGRHYILFGQPMDIQFFNRRASFRVDMATTVQLKGSRKNATSGDVETAEMTARLDDLSIGGCRISSPNHLVTGETYTITMPTKMEDLVMVSECIHAQVPTDERASYLHGFEFVQVSEVDRATLNHEVLRRDRALLRQRSHVKVGKKKSPTKK